MEKAQIWGTKLFRQLEEEGEVKSTLPAAGELHLDALVDELRQVECSLLAPRLIRKQTNSTTQPRITSQPPHESKTSELLRARKGKSMLSSLPSRL